MCNPILKRGAEYVFRRRYCSTRFGIVSRCLFAVDVETTLYRQKLINLTLHQINNSSMSWSYLFAHHLEPMNIKDPPVVPPEHNSLPAHTNRHADLLLMAYCPDAGNRFRQQKTARLTHTSLKDSTLNGVSWW